MEWLNWLDKEDKYSGMTAKQRKIQESIDSENDSDNQYYTKTASETVFKAISLKLDLIKSALNRNNPSKNSIPVLPEEAEQKFQEQSTTARMGKLHDGADYKDVPTTGSSPKGTGSSRQKLDTWQGGQEDSEYRKITNPEYTNDGRGMYDVQSAPSRKRGTPRVDPRMRKKDPIKTIPKTASWESWLEKNNGIETDHKKEDKHEWDGKFSSSNIKDEAEDDDKAISEEESLEELTDGKLEEIEKLKSWEIFLDKSGNATNNLRYYKGRHDKDDKKILNNDGSNYDKSPYHNQDIEADEKNRNEGTGKLDQDKRNWNTTEGNRGGNIDGSNMSYDDSEYDRKTGKYGVTEDGTRNEMRRINQQIKDENTKKPSKDGAVNPTQSPSNLDLHHADTQDVGKTPVGDASTPQTPNAPKTPDKIRKLPLSTESKITAGMEAIKSWELFLEKGIKYKDPDPKETDPEKIMQNAADPIKEITLTPDMKKKKSWSEWLEKMQGAGDARYGNQHLTGMEQHPVADDESMELSAETEENNEKQEEKEDKGDKDNKPYKALSQE